MKKFTAVEIMKMVGVSKPTIFKDIKSGKLRATKPNGKKAYCITLADAIAYAEFKKRFDVVQALQNQDCDEETLRLQNNLKAADLDARIALIKRSIAKLELKLAGYIKERSMIQ